MSVVESVETSIVVFVALSSVAFLVRDQGSVRGRDRGLVQFVSLSILESILCLWSWPGPTLLVFVSMCV